MRELIWPLFVAIIFSLTGCAHKIRVIEKMPDPVAFQTKHGINVYCDGVWDQDDTDVFFSTTDCYEQEEVEDVIDYVIDELVWRVGEPYSYKSILDFLDESKGLHDIFFKELEMGEEGSCGTKKNPKKSCTGFVCGLGEFGWCHGLHSHTRTCEGNDCTYLSTIRVAKNNICIGESSLAHEIIHFFQFHVANESDVDHVNEVFWPRGCTKEKYPDKQKRKECKDKTIVREVNKHIKMRHCFSPGK